MAYNSKFSGAEVEDALDKAKTAVQPADLDKKQNTLVSGINIKTINGQSILGEGDIVIESNEKIDLSDYATKEELKDKVDKVDGKQLSTEDFTTLLKQKLDGLSNYDDTEISQAISNLRTDLDTLVNGDTTTAIKTFNEVIAFLDGISDTDDLSGIIASIEQQIATKQDIISDLETIREGAAKGATALQNVPSNYVTTTMLEEAIQAAITNTLAEKV